MFGASVMPASAMEQLTLQVRIAFFLLKKSEDNAYSPATIIGVEKIEQNAAIRYGSQYQYPPIKCFIGLSGVPATTKKISKPDRRESTSQLSVLRFRIRKQHPTSIRSGIWNSGKLVAKDQVAMDFRHSIGEYRGAQ